jgi:hypothetical protein
LLRIGAPANPQAEIVGIEETPAAILKKVALGVPDPLDFVQVNFRGNISFVVKEEVIALWSAGSAGSNILLKDGRTFQVVDDISTLFRELVK